MDHAEEDENEWVEESRGENESGLMVELLVYLAMGHMVVEGHLNKANFAVAHLQQGVVAGYGEMVGTQRMLRVPTVQVNHFQVLGMATEDSLDLRAQAMFVQNS